MKSMLFSAALMASSLAMSHPTAGEVQKGPHQPTHFQLPGDSRLEEYGRTGVPEKVVFAKTLPQVRVPGPHTQVAWDNFDHRGTIMWGCRETTSGEFVVNKLCSDKPRNDDRWPGMLVPSNYRGILFE